MEGLHIALEKNNDKIPTQFGYELLRDHVLPSILGQHEDDILYWAGKEIARKFPILSIDELPDFFNEAGWGTLTLEKSTKHESFYRLTVDSNTQKMNKRTFQLESGFLAEQYQKINGVLTECFVKPKSKGSQTEFHVKWDLKTAI